MKRLLHMHKDDQIAIAVDGLEAGEALPNFEVVACDRVPPGHKIAIAAIAKGSEVRRLGQVIGRATADIAAGQWLHEHNLGYEPSHAARDIGSRLHNTRFLPREQVPVFQGYRRSDGKVGTRNFIGVIASVNCSSLVTRRIADHYNALGALDAYPGCDGVVALTHKSGCSVSDGSTSMDMLRRTLGGYIRHPNFAGLLIVGLGCEDNQIDDMLADQNLVPGPMLRTLSIQDAGGTRAAITAGISQVSEMVAEAAKATRSAVPASELVIGLQCGGSDGLSGLTANPALGAAVDRLVACGGTAILAETPEIHGAENLLLERAVNREVGERLIGLLDWWQDYTKREPHGFDGNASPGNREGGLTTILEKSLGAVAKGGTTNLVDVINYAEPAEKPGLIFMDSPGFDPVSATGQVASGATLVAFTTGRGSCFGCRPSPSIKLASNTPIFERMRDDMDFDCGTVLDGTETIEEMGERIFQLMLATASGAATQSEILGYGEDEFAPWHINAWL
ncbi:MAG: altronate dehydratase family protein [Hoeflea sp.]|uniref:UxaA family hydrolase n=1 Tax=Hoeflea sp. TaxID=1940281 RepID=UPI003299C706